jgi:hypothetical protein
VGLEGVLGLAGPDVGVPVRATDPAVWPEAEARDEPDELEGDAGASLLDARRVFTRGAGRGAARTTVRVPPAANGRAAGGESLPLTTSAGSVIAAPSAAPMSAATAMIPRLLLTRSPRSADPPL